MIDFKRIETNDPGTGFSLPSLFDPWPPIRTAPTPPAFKAFEMPESGHLIVFPQAVELRRKQAAQMRSLEGVVSNTH